MKKNVLLIVLLTFICMCLTSCKHEYKIAKQNYILYLDTVSNITVEYNEAFYKENKVQEILNKVNDILLNIEKEFSIEQTIHMRTNNILESTLMKVNKNSGISPVLVSDDFLNIVRGNKDV
jgi:thiamine biosynthesis lipoprotein ApbE